MELADTSYLDSKQFGKFSSLINSYLTQDDSVQNLYDKFPTEYNISIQAKEKLAQYSHRKITHQSLVNQLSSLSLSKKQLENLEKFKLSNTITITTGHQLNLMTGPVFFFHKILQVLKCSEEMNIKFPEFNFVPVFWMATEDHDFQEINHFHFQNQIYFWHHKQEGAVGKMDVTGIQEALSSFEEFLPNSLNAESLKNLIQASYFESKTLTEATRKFVQEIFGEKGLLMIDGDDKELKKLMISVFEEELFLNTSYHKVTETNDYLIENKYPVQVTPREINLFYLGNGSIRERIIFEGNHYAVLNSEITFTKEEILEELHTYPEKFSPNVVMRPLYQETILPNIAYIGGSGEIAYWLQLKKYFQSQQILFPILVVRNSFLLITKKQKSKLEKLNINYTDLLKPLYELVNENITENTELKINFEKYENQIHAIFDELTELSKQTDASFSNMVRAQKSKQLSGLEKMIKRFIKAEKKKHSERVERIENIYSQLFPNGNLQERVMNFSEFWLEYEKSFINEIYKEIEPLEFRFTIKTLP